MFTKGIIRMEIIIIVEGMRLWEWGDDDFGSEWWFWEWMFECDEVISFDLLWNIIDFV